MLRWPRRQSLIVGCLNEDGRFVLYIRGSNAFETSATSQQRQENEKSTPFRLMAPARVERAPFQMDGQEKLAEGVAFHGADIGTGRDDSSQIFVRVHVSY
jgi:hypothetical protein